MATTLASIRQTVRIRLLETLALTTPGSPLVAPQGTPGSSTLTYKIVAINNTGHSDVSQGTTITTSAATLSVTNFNRINWQAVPGASGYRVYRTATNGVAPTTVGLIGTVLAPIVTFDDTGIAGDASIPPTLNTSGIDSPFWTEQELLDIIIMGCQDLWRAIVDLHKGHFTTIDETNVSLVSSATTLTGVPADCFRVLMIEPRDLTNSAIFNLNFRPKAYNHPDFQAARGSSSSNAGVFRTVLYDILNAGSPVLAPTIVVAPTISTTTLLRLVYTNVLPTLTESSNNPIPGESDNALVSWGVAWARAKEREDRSPDPAYFATYSTDKAALLNALTPRQEQEAQFVEGVFEDYW